MHESREGCRRELANGVKFARMLNRDVHHRPREQATFAWEPIRLEEGTQTELVVPDFGDSTSTSFNSSARILRTFADLDVNLVLKTLGARAQQLHSGEHCLVDASRVPQLLHGDELGRVQSALINPKRNLVEVHVTVLATVHGVAEASLSRANRQRRLPALETQTRAVSSSILAFLAPPARLAAPAANTPPLASFIFGGSLIWPQRVESEQALWRHFTPHYLPSQPEPASHAGKLSINLGDRAGVKALSTTNGHRMWCIRLCE
mmetsp:Transcript_48026/g.91798  ORF Transcript_48026/g.91798 Transcript_48026/m.91798 type:complete len:263 (+) Transcript_48026:278-1066(+)|eukprot:CAMPEP_0114313702 /NCGR_PEP_ID=MMETSP0059-20121206/21289_1 /TAXON_ID=36894 /ORGANISM="Pyramimonas parkeae, Strain CCMP726" /LENGTH=262 /DNA_ID=CAMNT_0001438541 /DNA_START=344 /DNA_END=1132 /DNA_ORIENTATION=+